MDKTLLDRLEVREGNIANAARAAGVSWQRWNNWRKGTFSEDGQLRCWLALRPGGMQMLAQFRSDRAKAEVKNMGEVA